MDLIAIKRCFYRIWREPGERFTADRAKGRALVQMKLAKNAPVTAPATYAHRAVTETRRVDMQARPYSPLDHDRDGRPGGSIAPESRDDLATLRAEYHAKLGKRPFAGWSADVLRAKIAAASGEADEA